MDKQLVQLGETLVIRMGYGTWCYVVLRASRSRMFGDTIRNMIVSGRLDT